MMEEGLDGCDLADSEHREGEAKVTECRQPPEARKSKEADSPCSQKRTQLCQHPGRSPVRPVLDFWSTELYTCVILSHYICVMHYSTSRKLTGSDLGDRPPNSKIKRRKHLLPPTPVEGDGEGLLIWNFGRRWYHFGWSAMTYLQHVVKHCLLILPLPLFFFLNRSTFFIFIFFLWLPQILVVSWGIILLWCVCLVDAWYVGS